MQENYMLIFMDAEVELFLFEFCLCLHDDIMCCFNSEWKKTAFYWNILDISNSILYYLWCKFYLVFQLFDLFIHWMICILWFLLAVTYIHRVNTLLKELFSRVYHFSIPKSNDILNISATFLLSIEGKIFYV